jgi:hypothetical protein
MELKARLDFEKPMTVNTLISWLHEQVEFDPDKAMVRVGKTTGQLPVLIVTEER